MTTPKLSHALLLALALALVGCRGSESERAFCRHGFHVRRLDQQ